MEENGLAPLEDRPESASRVKAAWNVGFSLWILRILFSLSEVFLKWFYKWPKLYFCYLFRLGRVGIWVSFSSVTTCILERFSIGISQYPLHMRPTPRTKNLDIRVSGSSNTKAKPTCMSPLHQPPDRHIDPWYIIFCFCICRRYKPLNSPHKARHMH